MPAYVLQHQVTVNVYQCANAACGALVALTEDAEKRYRENHRDFYCTSGHVQSFTGKSEAEKLREEVKAEKVRASALADQLAAAQRANLTARQQLGKTRKKVESMTKRAQAAMCPVPGCKKRLVQLERHLATQHPDFTHAEHERVLP